jgi:hypothetical protein
MPHQRWGFFNGDLMAPPRKTTQDFIEKAKKVHGEKYDYSKTEYFGNRKKLLITCRLHGDFMQEAGIHHKGHGCMKCKQKIRTQEQWLEHIRSIHGDKFDYSEAVYAAENKPVKIICKEHGPMLMKAADHASQKFGCPKCAGNAKLTAQDFISKATAVHGHKYNYSLVPEVVRSESPIQILCALHGEFSQRASKHVRGQGCRKCAGRHQYSTEEAIAKLKEVRGDYYDYSCVVYKNAKSKITICCPIHGQFKQGFANHISGDNCPKCSGVHKHTPEEFIELCKAVHGDRYDYSQTVYSTAKQNVLIGCREHGQFAQLPNVHRGGGGCPSCAENGYRPNRPSSLYLLQDGPYLKIGITNREVKDRVAGLNRKRPSPFSIIKVWHFENGEKALNIETMALSLFRLRFKQQEEKWDGFTETFISDDVNHFISTLESIADSLK